MRIGPVLLATCSVLAAPVLLLQGFANAENLPGPLAWNGFWEAKVARSFVQAEQVEDSLDISLAQGGSQLARDAWAKEPLATDALSVLAIGMRASGEEDQLSTLLERVGQLERRNRFLAILRFEAALEKGEMDEVFTLLDEFARANPRFIYDFTRPLTGILEDPASLEILRTALEEEPVWAPSFWSSMPATPDAARRLYSLRQQADFGTSPETDARLFEALANNGLFEEAFEFWRETGGDSGSQFGFIDAAEMAPIGWRNISSGERAFSPRGTGQYEVYVQPYSQGELARQLVELPAGTYRFSARISPADDAAKFAASITCATDETNSSEPQSLDGPVQWTVVSDCRIYWLVLTANAWDNSRPLRADISDASFTRL